MSDEFADYDRRHPFLREFLSVFRKHQDADPDKLVKACIEALFDHLLNPPQLDRLEGPFETEARQIEAKLKALVGDEASAVCDDIRRSERS